MPQNEKQRLLAEAAKLMGREKLAAGLKVDLEVLVAWTEGRSTMPDSKLRALGDLMAKWASRR